MRVIIETERLILRHWKTNDLENLIRLCQEPEVMRFFPSLLDDEQSKKLLDIFIQHQKDHEFVYFAVDDKSTNQFIGFIGIKWQTYESHFTPCIDIGWRLLPSTWGKGYATEGAKACLKYAFEQLKIEKIYSVCPKVNKASEKVMQRIGMNKIDEFIHPSLPQDSQLNPCLLYIINQKEWQDAQ